jgi:aminopeptidase YwaD
MVFSNRETLRHLERLAGEIGIRTIGSSGDHAAAAYIEGVFRAAGLSVTFQDYPCPDWEAVFTTLALDGERLEAAANTFSPACDVKARTVAVGTLEQLESTEIRGLVPVFYGALAQQELAAQGAIYVSERDRRIIQLLEERGPAALITVNPSLHGIWRLIEDFDLQIPSVTVTARAGLGLLKRAGETVHLRIEVRRDPSRSANVIGFHPGSRADKIVLCAHYDTKVDTPGAYDNAAGVAVLLALAQRLTGSSHQYSLEFVAFSGEEVYGLGDMEYARRLEAGFERIVAAMNFDGVGPRLAVTSLAIFSASQFFHDLVREVRKAFPGVVEVDPWPASDHYIFYSHGVPSIALSSVGIKDQYHTPFDTIEWISPEKLEEAVLLADKIFKVLDAADAATFRSRESHS